MFEEIGMMRGVGRALRGRDRRAEQQIVNAIGGAGASGLGERLQLLLDLGDGVGVEQLAEIGVAEQIAKLFLIDGERLGAAFGERGIAIVDVVGNVAEEQRRGEGRRRLRVDDVDADLAIRDGAQDFEKRRHVEDIAHAFAIGLEQHGKRRVARSDGEQIVGALALLPERSAALGAATRQEQCARGALAEFGGEERGRAELTEDEVHGLVLR